MFGGTPARNMVNLRDKFAVFPTEGPQWDDEEQVKKWEAEWVLWKADLGSRASAGRLLPAERYSLAQITNARAINATSRRTKTEPFTRSTRES